MNDKLNQSDALFGDMGDMGDLDKQPKSPQSASQTKSNEMGHDIEEMNEKERNAITGEQALSIADSVKTMAEVSIGIQQLLLNPNGTPKDLADVQGRNLMLSTINNWRYSMDSLPDSIQRKVSEAIPQAVTVRFSDEDRKRIDFLMKWKLYILGYTAFFFIIVISSLFK